MNIRDYAAYFQAGQDWSEAFICGIDNLKKQSGVLNVPAGEDPTGSICHCDDMTLRQQRDAGSVSRECER